MIPSRNYIRGRRVIILLLFVSVLALIVAVYAFARPTHSSPVPLSYSTPADKTLDSNLSGWERAKHDGPQGMSLWGIGFDEASSESRPVGFHTLRVDSNKVITAPFHYLNRSNHTEVRRLFVLLDERQLVGGVGDDPQALYTDITVEPGEEITLTVTIPPLEPGAHDLVVISILNPDDPLGLDHPRSTLLAGDADEQVLRDYVPLADANLPVNPALFITDDTNDSLRELRDWEFARVAPEESIEYAIYVGYTTVTDPTQKESPGNTPYRFAILTFLDHQQIPVRTDGGMAFYGEVSKDTVGRTLGIVQAPKETGQHNLLVLLIENPGVVLSNVVRGPGEPGPATLLPWFVDAKDVILQVGED